jgi:outer membrane lipoprotein-sorting protein
MMKTGITAAFLALATVLFATALFDTPLAAQSLDEVFARMDKTAQQFRSVAADIKRTVHTAVINDDSVETGTIRVKREKSHDTRMLIDFTTPDAKAVAFDGATVSVYYPKINTVQVYDIGGKRTLVDKFLLLGFGGSSMELKNEYEVSWVGAEKIDGQQTSHIQLLPRSKEVLQRLKKAELWIADGSGLPAQQRFVTSAAGDFMLVGYTNVKFNPPLSDNSLKLNLPKGVQIQHPQL